MSIWSFFIDRAKVTWLLIAAIIGVGLFSMVTLPRESNIDIQIPIGIVSTFSDGAEAKDVEQLITDVLEQEIAELEGVKEINSTSSRSFSSIAVEFDADEDIGDAIRSLRDKVAEAKSQLPSEANDPQVTEVRFTDQAVLTFSLAGDYSMSYLSESADEIVDRLEGVSGVSRVDVAGDLQQAYRVKLNKEKIDGLGLSVNGVINQIRAANVGLPLGNMKVDTFEYGVRLDNRITSIQNVKDIVVASSRDNGFITLEDIAEIKDDYEDREVTSKVMHRRNGELVAENAVTFSVFKTNTASLVNVVDDVKEVILEGGTDLIPPGVSYIEILDTAEFVDEDIKVLGTSAMQTIALIIAFLIIFLGARESLIAATAIPISFFIVFTWMSFIGMKLNGMVLFSLVIGLGLLVDTAIVITEGLHENIVRKKMSTREGALLAIKQYNKPLLSGTLTTIFAFVPMFLVSGVMGEYLRVIPTILIILLSASYIVAMFFVPAIATRWIVPKKEEKKSKWKIFRINEAFDVFSKRQEKKYRKLISTIVASKWKRRGFVAGVITAFILATVLPATGILKLSLFPNSDFDFFEIVVELPNGSQKNETEKIVNQIEQRVAKNDKVSHFVHTIGAQSSLRGGRDGGSSGGTTPHLAQLTIHLIDEEERGQKSFDIAKAMQDEMDEIAGAEIIVDHPTDGPPSGSPVEIRVSSDDISRVAVITEEIESILRAMPEVTSTSTSVERGAGEFLINPRRELLHLYGISEFEMATAVRAHLEDFEVEELLLGGDEVSLRVEIDKKVDNSTELSQVKVGREGIPLSEIADISIGSNISSIRHRDQKRFAFARADLVPEANTIEVVSAVQKKIENLDASGVEISYGGEVEDIQQSLNDLFTAMIVGVILISLVLVIQFNSYVQPLMVLSMIPCALIGVFTGFTLIGIPLSFMAFLGIVGLAGIVVNDAIILVDKANVAREETGNLMQAAVDGGAARMQPIFLTSLTTIFGMVPLIWVNEVWRDFALAVIFGLIVSTILALFLAPILYVSLQKEKDTK